MQIQSLRHTFYDAQKPTILIVEDNVHQQDFLREILSFNKYECVTTSSIKETWEIFRPGVFACAFIDLGLPDGDGINLVKMLGEKDPSLVKIVLTGDASPETIIGCMRSGAFDHITKPVDLTTLSAALQRAIEHHYVLQERAGLFKILQEEREHLRARVDSATRDLRKYAANCEAINARLRSLLQLMQSASPYATEDEIVRRFFIETRVHIPIFVLALCDIHIKRGVIAYSLSSRSSHRNENVQVIVTPLDTISYDPILAEAEPEVMFRNWLQRQADINIGGTQILVYPSVSSQKASSKIGFFLKSSETLSSNDHEFLDMCAYLLIFEWERNKLLLHVAQQASLGNVAIELVKGFIQPLTALRTAVGYLAEIIDSPEGLEGIRIIEENTEKLWLQAQGFRKLSLFRENAVETVRLENYINQALDMLSVSIQNKNLVIEKNIRTDGECLVLNGIALARTFLDLILATVRSAPVGGRISITLRNLDEEKVIFELQQRWPMSQGWSGDIFTSDFFRDKGGLGLSLAERTIHSCGGTLTVDADSKHGMVLRIVLPRGIRHLFGN